MPGVDGEQAMKAAVDKGEEQAGEWGEGGEGRVGVVQEEVGERRKLGPRLGSQQLG